jgi:hypothetical protein
LKVSGASGFFLEASNLILNRHCERVSREAIRLYERRLRFTRLLRSCLPRNDGKLFPLHSKQRGPSPTVIASPASAGRSNPSFETCYRKTGLLRSCLPRNDGKLFPLPSKQRSPSSTVIASASRAKQSGVVKHAPSPFTNLIKQILPLRIHRSN